MWLHFSSQILLTPPSGSSGSVHPDFCQPVLTLPLQIRVPGRSMRVVIDSSVLMSVTRPQSSISHRGPLQKHSQASHSLPCHCSFLPHPWHLVDIVFSLFLVGGSLFFQSFFFSFLFEGTMNYKVVYSCFRYRMFYHQCDLPSHAQPAS